MANTKGIWDDDNMLPIVIDKRKLEDLYFAAFNACTDGRRTKEQVERCENEMRLIEAIIALSTPAQDLWDAARETYTTYGLTCNTYETYTDYLTSKNKNDEK